MNLRSTYSIVIPCYNEAKNLPWLIQRANTLFASTTNVELVLVDNGSTDHTQKVLANQLTHLIMNHQVITIPHNEGYGHGVWTGLQHAQGDYVGWTHADGQVDLSHLKEAIVLLEQSRHPENLYIKGSRQQRTVTEHLFSWGHSLVAKHTLPMPPDTAYQEINAPPNLCHRRWLQGIQTPPKDYQCEMYLFFWAQHAGAKVRYINIPWGKRRAGVSSWDQGLGTRLKLSLTTWQTLRRWRHAQTFAKAWQS